MIVLEHQTLTLRDFSYDYTQVTFDFISLNKPISQLTLKDLHWGLRKRIYIEQIIDLIVDKIIDNWNAIDQYYPTEITEWYDETIREIITFPFSFWNTKHQTHSTLCGFITKSNKRNLYMDDSIKQLFLSYIPVEVLWTKEDSDLFESDLSIGLGLEIAGNLIEAEKRIKKLKVAILHGQPVYVHSAGKFITTEAALMKFVEDEYKSYGDVISDIMSNLIYEKRIKTTNHFKNLL